jgi:tRNA threonylcarbamoyladenosine biosynthesis protein TsaB
MILALETSTGVGGAALLDGSRLVAEQILAEPPHRAATLISSVDQLLRASGRDLADVDVIALSIGPGSFTGLRIGLATALGLCFGSERLVVPVPTLAALALHAPGFERVAPWLDARKGQVYAGIYGPDVEALAPERVSEPLPLLEELSAEGPVAFLGPGAQLYHSEIRGRLGARATLLPAPLGWPRPASVGLLGARLLDEGHALPPERVEPRYLRQADAERARAGGSGAIGDVPGA